MTAPRRSQAVIVIHGIGEQRPMDTLRGFVEAVLPETEPGVDQYFSKPDSMSELFELRKLQNRKQPRTHFFEYYWAYKVEGTTFSHIGTWFSTLLLRPPKRVPKQLLAIWVLTWALIVAIALAAVSGIWGRIGSSTVGYGLFTIAAVSSLILGVIQYFVIQYVGDAARYLSPHPKNIALRREIRSDGIKLLRNLHKSGKYDRIIMVGHSLGTVIAYDVLKHFWEECHDEYASPKADAQKGLVALEDIGERLRGSPSQDNLAEFRAAQVELWKELHGLGNPWLVTDFVTLGSPLTHAALVLAQDVGDLLIKQRQRELPVSPPVPEIDKKPGAVPKYSFEIWKPFKIEQDEVKLRALHHSALFACTRWTNIYFPAYLGLFGDFVGGPLSESFGPGILDIPVSVSRWGGLARLTPFAHTLYWWKELAEINGQEYQSSLPSLVSALDLEGTHTFRQV